MLKFILFFSHFYYPAFGLQFKYNSQKPPLNILAQIFLEKLQPYAGGILRPYILPALCYAREVLRQVAAVVRQDLR